jgi:hypothetical protein
MSQRPLSCKGKDDYTLRRFTKSRADRARGISQRVHGTDSPTNPTVILMNQPVPPLTPVFLAASGERDDWLFGRLVQW